MTFLEEIQLLGKKIDSLWQEEKGKKQISFSKIAVDALQGSELHQLFNFEEFFNELWQVKELPKQLDLHSNFGHPPITLFQTDDFLIDIYFWVTPDISIHSHSFEGAFTVLQGLSLQSRYAFEVEENFDDQVQIGKLSLNQTLLIRPGQVQEILSGPEFIHQVWHLGFPTISIAVRTFGKKMPQYTYHKPYLAFHSHDLLSPTLQRQLQSLVMLHRTHQPVEPHMLQLASLLAPSQVAALLHSYCTATGDLALIERVVQSLPLREKGAHFLTSLRYEHETTFDMIEIADEDERFFLALLHIATSREQSEALFQAVFPDRNFEETILHWFGSLMKKKVFRIELNDTASDVFTYLFQGCGEEEICRRLAEIYEVEANENFRQEIRQCCDELHASALLKPFFPQSQSFRSPQAPKESSSSNTNCLIQWPAEKTVSTSDSIPVDSESAFHFNEKGYWTLRNVIDQPMLDILLSYFYFREKNDLNLFNDAQVKGSKGVYADPLCESLLLYVQPILEKVAGKELFPSYSYARIYGPSSVLEKHRDRPSCEISATLTIGYQAPALWPLFISSEGQRVKVELDRGDMLIYKGCELFHWREKFEGEYWVQVFLHFVDRKGAFAKYKNDQRNTIGSRSFLESKV